MESGRLSDKLPGGHDMFFLHPIDGDSTPQSVCAESVPMTMGILVCPLMFWPPASQAASWTAIYRLAYEQLLAAFAPSPFQRALEPSMN
jgi:hypothetical protein